MNKIKLICSLFLFYINDIFARCDYDVDTDTYYWHSPIVLMATLGFVGWLFIKKIAPYWSERNPYLSIFLIVVITVCLNNFVVFPGHCDSSGRYIE